MDLLVRRLPAIPTLRTMESSARSMWIPMVGPWYRSGPVSAARSRVCELGFRNAFLWVLAANIRAERFYRADRWRPGSVRRKDSVWGVTVNEFRYSRELNHDQSSPSVGDVP